MLRQITIFFSLVVPVCSKYVCEKTASNISQVRTGDSAV